MKALNRSFPVSPLVYRLADDNDFCVCRVLEDCALIRIESLDKLRAAKKYMRRMAAHVPGSYIVFSYRRSESSARWSATPQLKKMRSLPSGIFRLCAERFLQAR